MLLEFYAENYRSIRDGQALDLRANALRDLVEVVRHPPGLKADSRGVLPAIAIFGANASGKSSLFMAADFMRTAILGSASGAVEGAGILERVPTFRFNPDHHTGPVTLRVEFLLDHTRHEYGFRLQPRRSDEKLTRVTSEWLRNWPHGRERDLFLRGEAVGEAGHAGAWWVSEEGFHGGRRLATDLFEQTRDDVLFLSLASQRNHPSAKAVVTWFSEMFATAWSSGQPTTERQAISNQSFLDYLGRLLHAADTGIDRVEVRRDEAREKAFKVEFERITERLGSTPLPPDLFGEFFATRTLRRDCNGHEIALDLRDESSGTQRLFHLAGPIYDALRRGRCLWIDELDTAMHHWLVRTLIRLFQEPASNPHGAQLLFTTHDAAVMDPTLLRRDQIWIVEKDAAQGSQLYSLADIDDKPRKGQPLYKAFLSGRYGGVPRLDEAALLDWRGSNP